MPFFSISQYVNLTTNTARVAFTDTEYKLSLVEIKCTECKSLIAKYYAHAAFYYGGEDKTLCKECYQIEKLKE